MCAAKQQTSSDIWDRFVEKLSFGISEKHPVCGIHEAWSWKQSSRYDMHFGLELGIVLTGKMRRHFRDESVDVARGQAWLCGMWEPHGWEVQNAPCEVVVLIVNPSILSKSHITGVSTSRLLSLFQVSPVERPGRASAIEQRVLDIGQFLRTVINEHDEPIDAWLQVKLLEILLLLQDGWQPEAGLPVSAFGDAQKITKAIEMVLEAHAFVSTQQAARACGMNRNAFGEMFCSVMGIRFSEFDLRYRLSAAAEEMRSPDKPIKAIAMDWGFTDTSHLHRCFTKHYGMSPGQYRKETLQDID